MFFYFAIFLHFYASFFVHGLVLLFSILGCGLGFLLVSKLVIFWITNNEFLNFMPFKNLFVLCMNFFLVIAMGSNFACQCHVTWFFFVLGVFLTIFKDLNLGHAWVPKVSKNCGEKKLITRKKVLPSTKAPPLLSFLFFLLFFGIGKWRVVTTTMGHCCLHYRHR